MYVATLIAEEKKIHDGYRIVINNGKNGSQTVNHLHLHMLAGR
jgi:histidine triad (HIT) family protein